MLAVIAAVLTDGCSAGAKKAAGGGAPVLVARAFTTNVPVQIDPPPVGHVMPYSTVTVHSQIDGMIGQMHFQEGQEVKEGDLLFTIDPRPIAGGAGPGARESGTRFRAIGISKGQLFARSKIARSKIISQDQSDTDRASLDAAAGTVAADKAAITNALLNLEFCHINAPVDGVTGGLQSYVGNVVKAPDDTLLTINQIHPIYVAFAVPEQYLPEIRK